MATAEKILEIARSQIGTRESPANSDNVKYNTAYYGREVSGKYPWCAVFVWWVFREAGAPELYYGGGETAYCPTLMSFHKKQAVTDYRPGDIVFFNFSGKSSAGHVGICESWDGTYITTICLLYTSHLLPDLLLHRYPGLQELRPGLQDQREHRLRPSRHHLGHRLLPGHLRHHRGQ